MSAMIHLRYDDAVACWIDREGNAWTIAVVASEVRARQALVHLHATSRVGRMNLEDYAKLPERSVGDEGRRGWSFMCDCGRYHIVDDPVGEGDVLFCPRSKRRYRCL